MFYMIGQPGVGILRPQKTEDLPADCWKRLAPPTQKKKSKAPLH
jgi:hypothetical protein